MPTRHVQQCLSMIRLQLAMQGVLCSNAPFVTTATAAAGCCSCCLRLQHEGCGNSLSLLLLSAAVYVSRSPVCFSLLPRQSCCRAPQRGNFLGHVVVPRGAAAAAAARKLLWPASCCSLPTGRDGLHTAPASEPWHSRTNLPAPVRLLLRLLLWLLPNFQPWQGYHYSHVYSEYEECQHLPRRQAGHC
jgi:hypothetical protein